jgi:excinuclease ABC subunit A
VHQVLYRAVARALGQSDGSDPSGVFKSLTGVERLNDVVLVDQTPIGRTPRSNPITYIKGFDLVRELFAAQPESKKLSLTPAIFPSTSPAAAATPAKATARSPSRCSSWPTSSCPAKTATAPATRPRCCRSSTRARTSTRCCLTVKEALRFFAGQTKLLEKLAVLDEIGLGYLRLGQSATTLSGGEAQRVKLAAHLAQVRAANANAKPSQASRVLYILDEPTTGLHFDDVSKLLTAFRKLIDGGGSLIVIEHNVTIWT